MNWQQILIGVNDVLSAGVAATAFALLLYLWCYNRESAVARTFSGLLLCVAGVYLLDLLLTDMHDFKGVVGFLLRLQWVGIAFTPTLYLEFTRAIRLSVMENHFPPWLRRGGLLFSFVIVMLALYTDFLVNGVTFTASAPHLLPGPLFYPFAILFGGSALWGLRQTLSARSRCYTSAARRRMAYLSIGFIAPAAGVFPYLLIIGWPTALPGALLWGLLIVGNVGIAIMLVLMAYSVAFIGTLNPDRVIKHRMVRFLLRGPVTAMLALVAFNAALLARNYWQLESYTLPLSAVAVTIIAAELIIELSKPVVDLALYREGREEVARIQELSQRLLTAADLRQFLENILAAVCELLHSRGGFIAVLENGALRREIWCGLHISTEEIAKLPLDQAELTGRQGEFFMWQDYWIAPIHDKSGQALLGLVGVQTPGVTLPLPADQLELLTQVLQQAGAALEDQRLQQAVFGAFTPLLPELQEIQRRRGMLRYQGSALAGFLQGESPDFPQWVHDALAHYWGGPRLTENPLLQLQVVQQAALEHDGNPIRGLQDVLLQGIEQLRPDGERKLTAPEWLLYNILEMKFLRGQKVREVAMRLALSESDFYRKQRVAIESLARIIAEMEARAREI